MRQEAKLRLLYAAFNAKDLDSALAALAADVDWPNGWEGGRICGRDAVRKYWLRQWAVIDPTVEPLAIADRPDGSVEVTLHQVVRDMVGNVLSEQTIRHIYRFHDDVIRQMDIEE